MADRLKERMPEANDEKLFNEARKWVIATHQVCADYYNEIFAHHGPVVQSWVNTNPGLKFKPLLKFLNFYTSVYFKTSGP